MGSCCSSNKIAVLKKCLYKYYVKDVKDALSKYQFDVAKKDAFANRVAKENGVSLEVALRWIEFYIWFMIYVGWLYEPTQTHKRITKPSPDINKYLSLPYEILQVWRAHVLYTEKYMELCKIVSKGNNDFIFFTPPKTLWKTQLVETLQSNFRINREIILAFCTSKKKEVDALFIFQSTYLKVLLHFNLEEGSNEINSIVNRYENELKSQTGIFSITARNIESLKTMASKIENVIYDSIPKENYPGRTDWQIQESIQGLARNKVESFQNIQFPPNFVKNFCADHLVSEARAETYIDEYKKYLYLSYVTKEIQCPSEEVDLVWHYHQQHTKEYMEFSALKLEKRIYIHNPANGTEEDSRTFHNVYNNTLNNLQVYFGYVNTSAWPNVERRFHQVFRWYNHHSILQRCTSWTQGNYYKTNKVYTQVVPGCYVGCGVIWGRPYLIGCGVFVGCGGFYVGCGIVGCGAIVSACGGCGGGCSGFSGCSGGCGSGCSGGGGGCGGSGCGGGGSGCGGSGCGGGGCGGGGCGGGGCGG
jgi:hypothetical protein